MIPRSTVLATQNHFTRIFHCLVLSASVVWLCGCGEPGPRALLKGERLIKEGRFQKSLDYLQTAVRLLPNNAQAWNHLGLAYHALNQPQQALNAYHRALTFDHKLASARFNVGCLLLEQNSGDSAVEQLTTYTLLEPSNVQGWLKLGSAQIKSDQLDLAERSFKTALELDSNNPAALNGLGLIQTKRLRPLDGLQFFKKALAADPNFSPASLNLAIVTHDRLNNKSLSLQMYKQFLEMTPRPDNWEEVASLVQSLEQELNPGPSKVSQTTKVAALSKDPPAPVPANASKDQPVRKNIFIRPAPPKAPPLETNTPTLANPAAEVVKTYPEKIPQASTSKVVSARPSLENKNSSTILLTNNPPPPPIQVADLKPVESKIPKVVSEPVKVTPAVITNVQPTISPKPPATERSTPLEEPTKGESLINKASKPAEGFVSNRPSRPLASAYSKDLHTSGYRYIRPTAPLPGNRQAAEPHFKEGLKWHRAGRQAIAVEHYQEATRLDPAFFEAYFNQGLAASEVASWKHALAAYEMAMAINPNSSKAHYNFCMALKKANYPADSMDQLKLLLSKYPNHANAHLALANMYAQQFNEPDKARPHYLKVMEIDPFHTEAPKIRYWLSTNR